MRSILFILGLALACPFVSGQILRDQFIYSSTTLGPWVEHHGDWSAPGHRAQPDATSTEQILVHPNATFVDGTIEAFVSYNVASSTTKRVAGVMLRVNGAATNTDMVALTLEDANDTGSFQRLVIREYNATTPGYAVVASAPLSSIRQATVRLTTAGNTVVALVDAERDGIYETRLMTTLSSILGAGHAALIGNGSVRIDNAEIYNATLLETDVAPDPVVGQPLTLPVVSAPNINYQAASAFDNRFGFALTGGKRVPINPDILFVTTAWNSLPTIFQNFRGVLDANGRSSITVELPDVPSLAGTVIYTTFVSYDPTGIVGISPEVRMEIRV